MSAWIASDKQIASVVMAYSDYVEGRINAQEWADEIKRKNIQSVNHRYNERTKITRCDLSQAEKLDWKDVAMLAASIDYQSCELPNWERTRACHRLLKIRAEAGYKLADGGRWSI